MMREDHDGLRSALAGVLKLGPKPALVFGQLSRGVLRRMNGGGNDSSRVRERQTRGPVRAGGKLHCVLRILDDCGEPVAQLADK
jgi:hypothetical protein